MNKSNYNRVELLGCISLSESNYYSENILEPRWKSYFYSSFSHTGSMKYPKLEAENHWSSLVLFLGPTQCQNTKRYEQIHGQLRRIVQGSNKKMVDKYILYEVCNLALLVCFSKHCQFAFVQLYRLYSILSDTRIVTPRSDGPMTERSAVENMSSQVSKTLKFGYRQYFKCSIMQFSQQHSIIKGK